MGRHQDPDQLAAADDQAPCGGRGLADHRDGSWYIVDPLFAELLRRTSPLADRPALEP